MNLNLIKYLVGKTMNKYSTTLSNQTQQQEGIFQLKDLLLKIRKRKNTAQCMSNKNMLEIETKKLTISLYIGFI